MAGGFAAAAALVMDEWLRDETPQGIDQISSSPSGEAGRRGLLKQQPGNPVMCVMEAPIRLFKHLCSMREELTSSKNVSAAERLVRGLRFTKYEEHVCAVQYKGIRIFDPSAGEADPERFPFTKIVTDICTNYKLDHTTKENLLNAKLCEESVMLNFDIKFNVGQPGVFYYGKFMAVNIDGKIDFCFMFYRLAFQIAPDIIEHEHARKWLWFTIDRWTTYESREVVMDQKQLEDFQNYFRLRLFDILGGELRGLASTEPDDHLDKIAHAGPPPHRGRSRSRGHAR